MSKQSVLGGCVMGFLEEIIFHSLAVLPVVPTSA